MNADPGPIATAPAASLARRRDRGGDATEQGSDAQVRSLSLRTSLLLGLAYVVVLAIVALGVPLALSLEARVGSEVRSQAESEADVLAATAADLLEGAQRRKLGSVASTAARLVRGRVIIVGPTGIVLADSAGSARVGTSYASRPEIASALEGRRYQAQRYSRTLGQEILATAVPILHEGHVAGAVRVTQSVGAVNSAITRVELGLGALALVVLAIGLATGAFIAREIARPLLRLERVARRLAGGELDARADVEGSREQRSLAASFNEMAGRLARMLTAQRAFVADASHQLRTPLTGLRLRLEEARAVGVSDAADVQIVAGIAEVDRLADIVEELLLLGRAGERELPAERFALDELARAAAERWAGAAQDRGVALRLERLDGGVVVSAKPDAERALDVLIENAVLYSPAGGAVELLTDAGKLEVRDRGPGISEAEREAVFERFHRGAAGRRVPGGSGLGLAIARELARAWGGDVRLAGRDGGGAVATLELPLAGQRGGSR